VKKDKTVIDVINTQILNKSANYCPFPQNPKRYSKRIRWKVIWSVGL